MRNYIKFISIAFFLISGSFFAQEKTEIIFHESHEVKKKTAPFSDVVEAGNLFFLAGPQHNLTLDHVVKCTVILSSMEDFAAFNAVYSTYFTKKPARTTFAAKGLARNAKIEIDVIAVKPY